MHSFVILLHIFFSHAHAEKLADKGTNGTQYSIYEQVDMLANRLTNKLVDTLSDRALKASPFHHAALDSTTLGKPGHVGISQRTSPFLMPPAHQYSSSGGMRSLIPENSGAHLPASSLGPRQKPTSLRAESEEPQGKSWFAQEPERREEKEKPPDQNWVDSIKQLTFNELRGNLEEARRIEEEEAAKAKAQQEEEEAGPLDGEYDVTDLINNVWEAKDAIDIGNELFDKEDYDAARQLFQHSLTLPGSGVKRFRNKPALLSDGELQAAHYNLACCYSTMAKEYGDEAPIYYGKALDALKSSIMADFEDWKVLRNDPHLKDLRENEPTFEEFMKQYEPQGLFGRTQNSNTFSGDDNDRRGMSLWR